MALGLRWKGLEVAGMVAIRAMAVEDAASVAELTGELGYERTLAQIAGWVQGLAGREHQQQAFVACIGDEVVGWIEVAVEHRLATDACGHIGGLVVKEGVRSVGIGLQLCRHAERWVTEQGVALMRVTSRSTRERAHGFYLRDGYHFVKQSHVFEKPMRGTRLHPAA
jgi:GNAT superfamily N-acetyltransferase